MGGERCVERGEGGLCRVCCGSGLSGLRARDQDIPCAWCEGTGLDVLARLLQAAGGDNVLVQEMRAYLSRVRDASVADADSDALDASRPLTITNPEMLEHRGIRAGDIILTPYGDRAVAQRDYMLVEADVEPGGSHG